MSLLDQHGNPLQQRTLSRQQSEDMTSLLTRVAHHPARGLTPSRLNQILEAAERGDLIAQHELFRDIEPKSGSYPVAGSTAGGFGGPMTGAMRSLT